MYIYLYMYIYIYIYIYSHLADCALSMSNSRVAPTYNCRRCSIATSMAAVTFFFWWGTKSQQNAR